MSSDKFLHDNLSALGKVDPPLAAKLLNHEVDPTWKILRTKEGVLAACKSLGEDRLIHTNSLADPIREAAEWHANITKRSETLVVLGFGLGYHAIPLLETKSGFESIVMAEASVDLFALALSCRNLTPILTNPRIRILVGENTKHLHGSLTRNCKPPFQYTSFLPVTGTDRSYYDMVCDMLEEILFDYRSKSPTNDLLRIGVGQFLDYLTT